MNSTLKKLQTTLAIQALMGAATVAGLVLTVYGVKEWWVWVVAGIAVAVTGGLYLYLYVLTTRGSNKRFNSDSDPRFVTYFSDWYAQQGEHVVFCKDFEWLNGPGKANVVETLRAQADRATVILSDDHADACKRVGEKAQIIVIPPDIAKIRVKMSLYTDDMDVKSMIVQLKRGDGPAVRFRWTDDPVIIGLAETLVAACRHINSSVNPAIHAADDHRVDSRAESRKTT